LKTLWLPLPGLVPGFLLVALLLVACDREAATAAAPVPTPPSDYTAWLRSYDETLAESAPGAKPSGPEERVRLLLERARLSGDYADYRRAGTVLAQAPPPGVPAPCVSRARWHYALHRLQAAAATLQACRSAVDADEYAGLMADIAFYSGRYREAEQVYREQLNRLDLPQAYVRMALLRARTGAPGEAMALFEAAEQRYHGDSAVMRAWLKLQRGLVALDQGRLEMARALYLAAAEALPGWWLVDEHLAEVQALMGQTDAARRAYEDIVRRSGAPEFIDALAELEAQAGHAPRAASLQAQARAIYESRLAEFPEAAAGHALEHYLRSGEDPVRVLRLAEEGYRQRPYGEAAIGLAQALLLNGRAAEALQRLEAERAAGWDTPQLHWVMARAHARAGQMPQARAAERRARAGNPLAAQMYGAGSTQLAGQP